MNKAIRCETFRGIFSTWTCQSLTELFCGLKEPSGRGVHSEIALRRDRRRGCDIIHYPLIQASLFQDLLYAYSRLPDIALEPLRDQIVADQEGQVER